MVILAIIVGSIMGYIFIAGLLRGPYLARELSNCSKCEDGQCWDEWQDEYGRKGTTKKTSRAVHIGNATSMAILWPFTAPFCAGSMIGDRENRDISKRNREIESAKHKVELAKLRRQEDEELTKQLQDR